jgi:phosphopantothenoylcysteine decarboxylase/phosphopantothenate--cysteine ligase
LDPVRFIGNRSSGKMGIAIAGDLAARGAEVTLITGPTSVALPPVAAVVRVRTAADMHRAVMEAAAGADALVMAAAVANYRPETVADQKITHDLATVNLRLVPTTDIIAEVASHRKREGRRRPLLVGFAAETADVLARARAKRLRKGIDVIVANDVSREDAGFDADSNAVTIIDDAGEETLPLQSKADVARALGDRLERWLLAAPARPEPTRTDRLTSRARCRYEEIGVRGVSRATLASRPGACAAFDAPVGPVLCRTSTPSSQAIRPYRRLHAATAQRPTHIVSASGTGGDADVRRRRARRS